MERTSEPPQTGVSRGIQTRVAVLVLVAALAPMAALGWASLSNLGDLRDAVIHEHEALVAIAARQVERGLRDMLEALASVPPGARPAQQAALRGAALRSRLLSDSLVIDRNGAVVAGGPSPGSPGPLDPAKYPQVREAFRSGTPVVVRGPSAGAAGRTLFAVVPLRDATGATTEAALGVLDPDSPAWEALLSVQPAGPRARLRLLDESGAVLAGAAIDPRRTLGPHDVHVTSRLMVVPWTVSLDEPAEENFTGLAALRNEWMILAPALALVSAVFAWGVARSVKRPLARLDAAAAQIAGGDLTHPLPPLGEDEVGRLGRSFEAMRIALRGSVEGLRNANHQMEARVRERTRELEGLTRELSLRDELRGKLLRKVISAQEDERKRIARELHDETCQTIAALALRLDAAKSGPTPEERLARIDEAMSMATRSLDELHRIIFDLRPSILDDLGLLPAIRWIAQRHLAPHGIQVRCEFDEIPGKLPPESEIAVFRAVQEAFSNIVRHARAETVLVEVSQAGGWLEIGIDDDGRGFDVPAVGGPSASGRGLGLLGIRERLELIGGTASVASSPGSGTRVVLRIPVPG